MDPGDSKKVIFVKILLHLNLVLKCGNHTTFSNKFRCNRILTKVTFLESPGSIDYCYVFGYHREFRLRPKIVKARRALSLFSCYLMQVGNHSWSSGVYEINCKTSNLSKFTVLLTKSKSGESDGANFLHQHWENISCE